MAKRERRKRRKANKSEAAKEVEEHFVKRSKVEALANKRSDELFVLDDGPAKASKRDLKQDLVLARKLKAEDKARRKEQAQKDAHKELILQRRKASKVGRSLGKQLTTKSAAQKGRLASKNATDTALYDLWGDESSIKDATTKKTLTVLKEPKGNTTDNWVDGVLRRKGLHKGWRRARESSPSEHKNNKFGVKAAEVVAAGGSYNPDEQQRRQLVQEEADNEVVKQQVLTGKDRETLTQELSQEQLEDGEDGSASEGDEGETPAVEDKADESEDGEDGEDGEEDGEDWLAKKSTVHVHKEKLTRSQRNKQRRHKELLQEHARARAAKKLQHDLRRPKALSKEIRKEQQDVRLFVLVLLSLVPLRCCQHPPATRARGDCDLRH